MQDEEINKRENANYTKAVNKIVDGERERSRTRTDDVLLLIGLLKRDAM